MTSDQVVTVLVALLGGGFFGTLVQGLWQRRKLGADYAEVVARSATTLLQPLAQRVEELESNLRREKAVAKQLSAELAEARAVVRLLRNELMRAREEHQENRRQQGSGG